MIEDTNLFKYELAVVAIMKNEAPYVKEWVDYHLLAGVDHFYIYDNDSEDNLKDVLQPYIDKGMVDYEFITGKCAQMLVYNEAAQKYKFDCRYIAFIDADEFIFPKDNKSIVEVLHEVLDNKPFAGGLAINWHTFGSGGNEKADLTKGVIERFKYRAEDKFEANKNGGNAHVKVIVNPRIINYMSIPHNFNYFLGMYTVDENGKIIVGYFNADVPDKKIIINHYFTKSKEEYANKVKRGNADCAVNVYKISVLETADKASTIYDDSITKYIDVRKNIYTERKTDLMEINKRRFNTVFNILAPIAMFTNLSMQLLKSAPPPVFFK